MEFWEKTQAWWEEMLEITVLGIPLGQIVSRSVRILLILIISWIAYRLGKRAIRFLFRPVAEEHTKKWQLEPRKVQTLSSILVSVLQVVIAFIALSSILSVLDMTNAALSMIATAGLGGLVIGFGAQSLVKDVITGGFLLLEDQYAVGDYVTIGDVTGTVERVTLRVTYIRGHKGELNVLPNGSIQKVTNYARGDMLAVVDVTLIHDTDAQAAIKVLEDAASAELGDTPELVAEPPKVLGIVDMNEYGIVIRTTCRASKLNHWLIERKLRFRFIQALEEAGFVLARRWINEGRWSQ